MTTPTHKVPGDCTIDGHVIVDGELVLVQGKALVTWDQAIRARQHGWRIIDLLALHAPIQTYKDCAAMAFIQRP